jgi:hypothetical protein
MVTARHNLEMLPDSHLDSSPSSLPNSGVPIMSEAVRKPRPRKKASEPTQEELIESEVMSRVSAIINGEEFDRLMLSRMTNAVSSLAGCFCNDHPLPPHVITALSDAMRAGCERIERIACNDMPLHLPCSKCGD